MAIDITRALSGLSPIFVSIGKKTIPWLLVFFLAALPATAADKDRTGAERERCPVCGMFVAMFVDWNGRIEFLDSTQVIFDGPKDMFKYYLGLEK